jgi:hypothetical protein
VGTVTPSLVNRIVLEEAGSGSDRIDNAFGVARNLPLPSGGRMPPMSTSGWLGTLASHSSAPRKSRQDVGVFREARELNELHATRRQDAANEHQRMVGNLGFAFIRPEEKPTGCRRFP